jgi:hypothetical protein
MITAIGIIVAAVGLICWIGPSLAVFALPTAIRLGVAVPEAEVDQSMHLFERFSQGIMDILLTWILPLSAILMLAGNSYWPFLALVGGGVYLYFPGVYMITRVVLKRHGKKVGSPSSVISAHVVGSISFLSAITMIVLAIMELQA